MFSSLNTIGSICYNTIPDLPPNNSFVSTSTVITSNTNINSVNINNYNWPICISGGTISSPIVVYIDSSINIVNATQYFIVLTDYVTIDGSYNTITISGSLYSGLIQNGSKIYKSFNNITVQNIVYNTIGTCDICGGWLAQSYYGKNINTNTFNNCFGNVIVSTGGGGVVGAYSYITCNNCVTNVNLSTGSYGGGILGQQSTGILNNCYVNLITNTAAFSGGLVGYNSSIVALNCLVNLNTGLSFGANSYFYSGNNTKGTITNSCANYYSLYFGLSSNILSSSNTTVNNSYFNQSSYWNDISVNSSLSNINSWTDIDLTVLNKPYVLSSFNCPLYNSNTVTITSLPYTTSTASNTFNNFQIISVNNTFLSFYPEITINSSNGQITFSSSIVSNTYIIKIYATNTSTVIYSVNTYTAIINNANYPNTITKTIQSNGHTLFSGTSTALTRSLYTVSITYNYRENGSQVYFNNGIYQDISNGNYYTVFHFLNEVGNNSINLNYDTSVNIYTLAVGGGAHGGGGVDVNNIVLNTSVMVNEVINATVAYGYANNYYYSIQNFSPSVYYCSSYLTFKTLNKRIIAYYGDGATGNGGNSPIFLLDSSYNIVAYINDASINGNFVTATNQIVYDFSAGYMIQGHDSFGGGGGGGGAGMSVVNSQLSRPQYYNGQIGQFINDNCGGSGRRFDLYGMNKSIYWGGGGGGRTANTSNFGGGPGGSGGFGGGGGGSNNYNAPGSNDGNGITSAAPNGYNGGQYSKSGGGAINTGGGYGGGGSGGSSGGGSGIIILSFEHKPGYNLTPINSSNTIYNSYIIYAYNQYPNFLNGYYTTSASSILSNTYRTTDPFLQTPSQSNGWASDSSYNTSGVYIGNYQTISSSYKGTWLQIQSTEYFFLTSYSLVPNASAYSSFPKTFWIFGSVDGTNWTLLDTQTNASIPTTTTPISYSLTFTGRTPSNYIASRYFRIVVNSTFNGTYTNIVSWNIKASYGFTPT